MAQKTTNFNIRRLHQHCFLKMCCLPHHQGCKLVCLPTTRKTTSYSSIRQNNFPHVWSILQLKERNAATPHHPALPSAIPHWGSCHPTFLSPPPSSSLLATVFRGWCPQIAHPAAKNGRGKFERGANERKERKKRWKERRSSEGWADSDCPGILIMTPNSSKKRINMLGISTSSWNNHAKVG